MPLCPVRHCIVYSLFFLCCSEQINDWLIDWSLCDRVKCKCIIFATTLYSNRFRGFGAPDGWKSLSPIDWMYRPYNSLHTNVLHCNHFILIIIIIIIIIIMSTIHPKVFKKNNNMVRSERHHFSSNVCLCRCSVLTLFFCTTLSWSTTFRTTSHPSFNFNFCF